MMVDARVLLRFAKNWRVGVRAAFVILIGLVLAIGSVVFGEAKAYAAVAEVRTPLSQGADTVGPLLATGSTVVFGNHRSTNSGASWATDSSLLPMRASSWAAFADGKLIGDTGDLVNGVRTYGAVVYTVETGTRQTYPLPDSPNYLGGSWMLAGASGATVSVFNFETQSSVTAQSPAGLPQGSQVYAQLTASGGLLWNARTIDSRTAFSYASSPTATPGPWTSIDGLVGYWSSEWTTSDNNLRYLVDSGTSVSICTRVLDNLVADPTCVVAWSAPSTDFFSTQAWFYDFGATTAVTITRYATNGNEERSFVFDGTTVHAIQLPAGSVLERVNQGGAGSGDVPYVMVRDSADVPTVKKLNSDGSLGTSLAFPTSVTSPWYLSVTPDRTVGADVRDGSTAYTDLTAWSRSVSATGFGDESVLPRRASWIVATAARTIVSGPDGLSVYDRGQQLTTTIAGADLVDASGPYYLHAARNPDGSVAGYVVSTVDGAQVATFSEPGQLFGSYYVTENQDPITTTTWHVTVNDLTGKASPRTVDLPTGISGCYSFEVRNGLLGITCDSATEKIRVYDLATGAQVKSIEGRWLYTMGDGYVVTAHSETVGLFNVDVYEIESLTSTTATTLTDCTGGVVTDGVGHVVCSSGTELIWRDFSSLSTSAGRVLGWLAPTTFASGAWTPQIDTTKAFNAGTLKITQGSTVIRTLTVPASADGSVRGVSWDGKDSAGQVAPSGTYTVELAVTGKDGTGAVKAIDGVADPTVDVSWTGGTVVTHTPGSFTPLSPYRLADTRVALGGAGPVAPNGLLDIQVTGRGGVPATGAGAVILNVTAVTPKGSGFLTVFPTGSTVPNASNLNFTPGQVVPNLVVAKIGTGGKVSVRNGSPGATEVVADVAGYFADGSVVDPGGLTSVSPARLLDTRESGGAVSPSGSVKIQVTGRGGVPASGVSAAVVNLTAVLPQGSGFLTAYPTGGSVPNASNVNFTAGQVVPNLAFVKLAADGSFTVQNSSPGATQVVADVAGYVLSGTVTGSGMFVPLAPARVLDTRPVYGGTGAVPASGSKVLTVTGVGGVPATGVSGVVLNVTAVASAAGFLTLYPSDVASAPNASNLNFTAGQVVPNLVAVKTSASGAVTVRNGSPGATDVIADVAGYFTA